MTPNELIYHIKQNRDFSEIWKHFSRKEKEELIHRMEILSSVEIQKTLLEVKTGQNRLF